MRRFLTLITTTSLLLAAGCGGKSYDIRLDKTLEQMRYRKRLDENLNAAPKGKFEENMIFLRPPKNLQGPTKEFLLPLQDPAKFDLAESFFEKDKQQLYVLAWVKRPPKAPSKKGAPKADAPVPRDESRFSAEVAAALNSFYGVEIDLAKAKEERKKDINVFKRLKFEANGKIVQLYLSVVKGNPYQVALIFEYPKSEEASLVSKIELCLESFATGERARKAFSGGATEEESEGGPATPTAF
ncbi:MAG: hypothetical protein LC745_09390 [Planctomycetia bacterium]|nr:hypothetical protein [Planctomycetia bacterium]